MRGRPQEAPPATEQASKGAKSLKWFRAMTSFSKILIGVFGVPAIAGLTACSSATTSLTTAAKLTVVMYGVFEAPVDATGGAEPRFQTYTLNSVDLVDGDGVVTALFSDPPKSLRIVNRSQIIAELPLTDYVGKSFSSVRVGFDPDVVGGGKIEAAMPATLGNPVLELVEPITVAAAKDVRLKIKVQWKNTVSRDEDADPKTEVMSAPGFSMAFGDE